MANTQITPFQLTDQFTMDNFNQRINETNTALQKKADSSSVYTKSESISAETRTALSLPETATPDNALAEIARQLSESGGLQMNLLWKNASLSSDFNEQTLSINTSGYDIVKILSYYDKNHVFTAVTDIDKRGSTSGYILSFGAYQASDGYVIHLRPVEIISDNEIKIYNGRQTQAGVYGMDNNRGIPFAIYGIKGVKTE